MEEKKTLGQVAIDLQEKAIDNIHTAHDQMEECLTDWDKGLFECVNAHKGQFQGDFYVVVITKKERLFHNVFRNYFFARQTCPTPDYDQTLYRYDHKMEIVEFVWVIPAKEVCMHMTSNVLHIPKEEKELLGFVLDFADGSLYKKCKQLNGEKEESLQLEE